MKARTPTNLGVFAPSPRLPWPFLLVLVVVLVIVPPLVFDYDYDDDDEDDWRPLRAFASSLFTLWNAS